MRSRLQFALDRLHWRLWPIKEAITWIACKTTGHVWIETCPCGPHCAWCGVSPKVKSGTDEQAGDAHG